MEQRPLGRTGLSVSRLGVGMSEIGYYLSRDETARAAAVLNLALDNGINFLDTAACYDLAEEFIGRTVSHRRAEFVLATKAGHAVADDDGADWQVQTITNSIDRSLRRMKTDYLDLIQLHSCGVHVLERGDAIRALQDARQAGKVRFIGYSGDNAAARWAIDSGLFDTLQTSYNLVDQHARTRLFPHAVRQGMGIIAKRPVANAVWGASVSPRRYANAYLDRAQQMLAAGPIPEAPDNGVLLALGFVLAETAVDVAIVGTRTPEKMEMNIRWLHTALPISNAAVSALQARFTAVGPNWPQLL